MNTETIQKSVREHYGQLANTPNSSGCGCGPAGGCCGSVPMAAGEAAQKMGYTVQDTASVPEGASLGLGCGNPLAIASLKLGETVLDLGSGAGFDCFLAAQKVGPTGKVIGVDMTPEMVSKARENARKPGSEAFVNVEFRLGEIEHLPVADSKVDIIISNCVINLSTNKEKVFKEAYRVLKAGGRLAIFDVLAVGSIPEAVRNDLASISGCVGGAESVAHIRRLLESIGFEHISIDPLEESRQAIERWFPGQNVGSYVRSAAVEARKPVARATDKKGGNKKDPVEHKEIRNRVYQVFRSGGHCAEAVSQTVLEVFSSQPVTTPVRCAAGFGGGVGGTFEEVCGALSGGILALGLLLGRNDLNINRAALGEMTREFREQFLAEFGSSHCGTLKDGFAEKNEPLGCARLSAQAAVILADMLYRFESQNNAPVETWEQAPAPKGSPGDCPLRAALG